MVTAVGKESDVLDLLNHLIELDLDAIEAYQAAITRIDDPNDKVQLAAFMADHRRHVTDLGTVVSSLGGAPATKPDVKQLLTKGKVVLAGIVGDRAILSAMKSNEDDTNTAYERAVSRQLAPSVRDVLERNLADERRHRAWIVDRLSFYDRVPKHS